ncbi:MAG: hypothetical protein U9M89_02940, partial [Patescibacteria group bacterium]|nr:hypothetical protein [Patescibacteria group bacterium]
AAGEQWEQRQVEAVQRLEAHTQKVHEMQAMFEERLEDAETDQQKARIQNRIDHMNQMEERRTEHLNEMGEREFPGVEHIQSQLDKLGEWQNMTEEERAQVREEMRENCPEGESRGPKGTGMGSGPFKGDSAAGQNA